MSGYLAEIYQRYGTEMWCDTPNPPDLSRLVGLGAVGATSNPVLMLRTVQAAPDRWRGEVAGCRAEGGLANWTMYRRVAREAAEILQPVYRQSAGKVGLLSVQVDPRNWNDPAKMIPQAREADAIAPNISVKLPVTKAGLVGIEELAANGISCTATVSFSVPQAIAIAEAFKRGKARAEKAGKLSASKPLHSYTVLMVGRLDDHLRDTVKERGLSVDPELLTWAGIAVGKRANEIFRERGYESKLLIAALRGNNHIEQFVGGDLVISMPPANEQAFGEHVGHKLPAPLIDEPVPSGKIEELSERFVDFRRAYAPDGMQPEEFDSFGPTVKTINQFSQNWEGLIHFVESAEEHAQSKEATV